MRTIVNNAAIKKLLKNAFVFHMRIGNEVHITSYRFEPAPAMGYRNKEKFNNQFQ